MKRILFPFVTALFSASSALFAGAADDAIDVRVLSGWRASDGTHMAAIEMRLAEGWKTYWRAPGDAGIPPLFDWSSSRNVSAVKMLWPVPEAFDTAGQPTLGYSDSVILPVIVDIDDESKEARVKGRMDIGLCAEICVPVTAQFDQILPMGGKRNPAILAAMIDQPLTAKEANVAATTCKVDVLDDGLAVTVHIDMPNAGNDEIVVIEHPDKAIWVSQADTKRIGNYIQARSRMLSADGSPILINRSELRFTVLGANQAVDIQGCTAG